MKKLDLQVYFHDLKKRYDNMDTDPDVQRVDYQVMAHNALTVMKRIIDEGLDDEQKRLKAYHDGYDQGRFDEYADRMGKEQAEKVKGKLERQKNCPYCHEQADYYAEPITGGFNDIGCGLIHASGNWYMSSWDFDVMKVADDPVIACPMCGRPLNEEEE